MATWDITDSKNDYEYSMFQIKNVSIDPKLLIVRGIGAVDTEFAMQG
jgi:hypothetical protein